MLPAVVDLNVGGRHFTTALSTLTKYPDSMLGAMFSGRHNVTQDKDGRYFIDMDGEDFHHILRFLRFKTIPPGKRALDVFNAADYLGLAELKSILSDNAQVKIHLYFQEVKNDFPEYDVKLEVVRKGLFRNEYDNTPLNSQEFLFYWSRGWGCNGIGKGPCIGRSFPRAIEIKLPECQTAARCAALVEIMIQDLKKEGVTDNKRDGKCYCALYKSLRLNVLTVS